MKNLLYKSKKMQRYFYVRTEKLHLLQNQQENDILLLSTPAHGNLGDQAIAIAEKRWLSTNLGNININEISGLLLSEWNKNFPIIQSVVRHTKLLMLTGGGFLGSLWPNEEEIFRLILETFCDKKIIVFPQTIYFDMDSDEGRKQFNMSKKKYSEHGNLTICAREKQSYQFMKANMPNVNCILIPDMVMTMESLDIPQRKRTGVIFCFRNDIEKSVSIVDNLKLEECVKKIARKKTVTYIDTVIKGYIPLEDRTYYVYQMLEQFMQAELVITDRLHGMLFSLITGTPCIALNNKSGKVKAAYEWLEDVPYILFADDTEEITDKIEKIDIKRQWQFNDFIVKNKYDELVNIIKKDLA